jgi:hypothetical protein
MSPDHPEIALIAAGLTGPNALYDYSKGWDEPFWEPGVKDNRGRSKTPGTSSKRNIKNRFRSTRLGLPITLDTAGGPATVLACADTGAEENIISYDLATALGLRLLDASPKKEFMLASGKVVEAIGQISALCSFGVETWSLAASMRCVFNVFLHLASPIIMGEAFLEETQTMTRYRERLVRIQRPNLQALQVYSLGRPRKDLMCYINGELTRAIPDSGSDLDIMTPQFAQERGLHIHNHEEIIEFADGSTALTCGFVQVELAVMKLEGSSPEVTKCENVDIFLLDQFVHNMLIGVDSIEELNIFTKHSDALVPVIESTGPLGLHHIRRRGALDAIKSWVKSMIKRFRKDKDFPGKDS